MNFNFIVAAVALTGLFGLAFVHFGLLQAHKGLEERRQMGVLARDVLTTPRYSVAVELTGTSTLV